MKKFAVIIIPLLSAISCTNLDEVWAELRDHEERIQTCHNILQAMIFM